MNELLFDVMDEYVSLRISKEALHRAKSELHLGEINDINIYDGNLFSDLAGAVAKLSGFNRERLLFDLGRFFLKSPSIQKIYCDRFRKISSREFLLEIADIHKQAANNFPGAKPPTLILRKPSFDELDLVYSSKRRLCPFLKGIIQGAAECFREQIAISEPECMEAGNQNCLINIKFLSI